MNTQYETAVLLVRERKTASTHLLKIYLGMTYREAQDCIEKMERENIITAPNAQGKRTVIKQKPTYTDAQLLSSG